ncbi:protein virilizer homolog [Nerophis ophidion]|uniref:protein virilizer homolog n=1 Tax=Nerophis ophidion TaxID=159077 RepID=UPI002ADF71C4|nr:protein virilizer homolog [Nerophis ophidion]
MLKDLIRKRLIAAADDIFELFERTMRPTRRKFLERGKKRRDMDNNCKWCYKVKQTSSPPHIKVEAKDLWTNQEGEGLLEAEEGLLEAEEEDLGKMPVTVVSVKAEDDEDDPQAADLVSPLADSDETSDSHGEEDQDDGREPLSSDTDCEGDLRT